LLQYDPVSIRMRFISPILKRAVYPTLHRAGYLNRVVPPGGYAVVNYHGVIPSDYQTANSFDADKFLDGNLVQSQVFRRQLRLLKAHYRILPPEEFRASIEQGNPLPPRSVLVTCDDGLLNTLTDMLPILESENVPCLFFVTAASCSDNPGLLWYEELYHCMRIRPLGILEAELPANELSIRAGRSRPPENFQSHWWSVVGRASQLRANARADWMELVRNQAGQPPALSEKRARLLNLSELKRLSEPGMTIGAHTRTHPVLSLCSDEESRREIHESKLEIERALGRRVWAFAYPFGNPATMGDREFGFAEQAGFSCAFLNVEYWSTAQSNFAIARTHVTSDMSLAEFSAHLSGFHSRLQRAVGS
jgi:peptidoglycan/xylan/chitin deacetylase (PgdA/CDA1 family)